MVSWLRLLNSDLGPYLEAAALGDWYEALSTLIKQTDLKKLEKLQITVDSQIKDLGFPLPKSFHEQMLFYLKRVRGLIKRELLK